MYTIKQVSEKLQMNANAIRFYEEKGLLSPKRGENNYREYGLKEIGRLETIVLYRKMGFSIEAVKEILDKKEGGELLGQFASQYEILNQHIHTMVKVRETLGECVELLLNDKGLDEEMLGRMEKTARIITMSNEWEDKWHFDDWASDYDADIRKGGQGLDFYRNYDKVIAGAADRVQGKRIVEVGIGTGNLAKEILAQALLTGDVSDTVYTGIDQSVNMLRQARKKCPGIELKIGTFLLLPLEDNCCDTVVSSYAFHHCSHEQIDELIWIITADKQV